MKIILFCAAVIAGLAVGVWTARRAAAAPTPGFVFVLCGSPSAADGKIAIFSNIIANETYEAAQLKLNEKCAKASGCVQTSEACTNTSNKCCSQWNCNPVFGSTMEAVQQRLESNKRIRAQNGWALSSCSL